MPPCGCWRERTAAEPPLISARPDFAGRTDGNYIQKYPCEAGPPLDRIRYFFVDECLGAPPRAGQLFGGSVASRLRGFVGRPTRRVAEAAYLFAERVHVFSWIRVLFSWLATAAERALQLVDITCQLLSTLIHPSHSFRYADKGIHDCVHPPTQMPPHPPKEQQQCNEDGHSGPINPRLSRRGLQLETGRARAQVLLPFSCSDWSSSIVLKQ